MGRGQQLIQSIFDVDNRFMRFCEKVFDLVLLNLLFVLSCLPLLTIGIAKISLYETLWILQQQRRVSVFSLYLGAFRKNGRLGLKLGALEGLVFLAAGLNLWLFSGHTALPFQLVKVASIALWVFVSLILLAAYPMAGKYQLDFRQVLQNSLLVVSLHFVWFFLMGGVLLALLMLLYLSGLTLILGLTLFFLIGFAALGFGQIAILERLFRKYNE